MLQAAVFSARSPDPAAGERQRGLEQPAGGAAGGGAGWDQRAPASRRLTEHGAARWFLHVAEQVCVFDSLKEEDCVRQIHTALGSEKCQSFDFQHHEKIYCFECESSFNRVFRFTYSPVKYTRKRQTKFTYHESGKCSDLGNDEENHWKPNPRPKPELNRQVPKEGSPKPQGHSKGRVRF